MRLSLAVIVKDELERVNKIISEYAQYFDELAFAVDDEKTLQTLKDKYTDGKIKFYSYNWCDDFSHKRNFLREKLTGDYYFRIDTDDAIINPERIRKVAEDAYKNNYSVVVCYYLYSKDENGNCNAAHYRETIIKNTPNLIWNKAIHENIIPKSLSGYKLHIDESIKIDHQIDFDHSVKSITRNLLYLIKEYNKDKADTDPRTLAYLGRTFFSMKNWDKAIFFLQKHIASSGWDDDRYLSWSYLAEIFNQRNEYKEAIACANEALQERPDYPDAYFKLHDIYFAMKEWEKAIQWGELGFTRKHPRSFIVLDPSAWTWRPAISMAFCYAQQDKWEEALKHFQYAKKLAPNVAWIQKNERYFSEGYALKKFNEDFLKVYTEVRKHDFESAGKLVASLPKKLRDSELIMSLERKHSKPKVWTDDEICFLCPMSVEEWSPKSVAKGIGGSEEAVIHMSKELQKLGYKVTVYTDCAEDEGDYDGVRWIDWHKFNPNDIFSHLVGWRVNIGGYKFKAKNKIIWLHDIPNCLAGISNDEVKGIDKVIVLSNFHKSLLPKNIPDDKIIVSTNGINPDDFIGVEEKREPHRIIYASSYDRGLETILSSWSEIRKEVPDATIHIYYGWNTYDALAGQGMRKNDFKEKMQKLMQQDGVYEHGRVGHKELLREYAKASIFAYPCNYVGEINCVPAGTVIRTKNGGKKIEDITTDDYVITHLGNSKRVCMTMRKKTNKLLNIKVRNAGNLQITEEHPILSSKIPCEENLVWNEAKNLSVGDFVVVPKTRLQIIDSVDIKEESPILKNNLPIIENNITEHIKLDETMCRWFGYFIGDGTATARNQVEILVSNKHKERDYENIRQGFLRFGLTPTEVPLQGCIGIRVNSGKLTRWLKNNFYTKERIKKIPEWLMCSPYPKLVIEGLVNSDGYIHYDKWNGEYEFTNKSIEVIEGLRQLLVNEGFACSLGKRKHPRGGNSYHIRWRKQQRKDFINPTNKNYIFLKVLDIEDFDVDNCDVYNIEVEDDNSYIAEGIAVHNCIALTKAVASGCVAVTNDFAVMGERNPHFVFTNEEFIPKLIDVLRSEPEVINNREEYIRNNSWATVAKDWKERVFSLKIPVAISDRHSWIRSNCPKDKKIVDIGCNKGHMFDGWDRTNITSVDIDEYEIENFVRANAEELPFIDKQFDIALLAEIVEHCKNPIKALTEARRVAKQIIVTVPWEHRWTSALLPFSSLEDDAKRKGLNPVELAKDQNPEAKSFYSDDGFKHLYHETFYTPDLLTEHLTRAGFTSIELHEIRFDEWVWLGAICG